MKDIDNVMRSGLLILKSSTNASVNTSPCQGSSSFSLFCFIGEVYLVLQELCLNDRFLLGGTSMCRKPRLMTFCAVLVKARKNNNKNNKVSMQIKNISWSSGKERSIFSMFFFGSHFFCVAVSIEYW